MNFIQKLNADLQTNCLSETQATEIVDLTTKANPQMRGRWHEDVTNYPDEIYNVIWAGCKIVALNYIDEHCPKAWFRAVFDATDPIHAEVAAARGNAVKVEYDLTHYVWSIVVDESIEEHAVDSEGSTTFVVEYANKAEFDKALTRFEGAIKYKLL